MNEKYRFNSKKEENSEESLKVFVFICGLLCNMGTSTYYCTNSVFSNCNTTYVTEYLNSIDQISPEKCIVYAFLLFSM